MSTSSQDSSAARVTPVPTEYHLEVANREINKLFGLFYDVAQLPANTTGNSTSLRVLQEALEEFQKNGMRETYQFMQPAWEFLAKLEERISRALLKGPRLQRDGCLLVATYPGMTRLLRDWHIQQRNLQTILTRIDVSVARQQDPELTRDAAKVLIGLKPRLILKTEKY